MSMNINTRMQEIVLHVSYKEFTKLRGFKTVEEYAKFVIKEGMEDYSTEQIMYADYKNILK